MSPHSWECIAPEFNKYFHAIATPPLSDSKRSCLVPGAHESLHHQASPECLHLGRHEKTVHNF